MFLYQDDIMHFTDITVELTGQKRSQREYETQSLVREAVEVFAEILREHGTSFRANIPVPPFDHIELQFTREGDDAMATFYSQREGKNVPLATSALVWGQGDETLKGFSRFVVTMLGNVFNGTLEPAFDSLGIEERPACVTLPIPGPTLRDDRMVVADMGTCLAAAYFERMTGN